MASFPSMSKFMNGDSSDSFVSYIDGVAMYSAINVAAMFLVIILTLFWLLCGTFCLCLRCCNCCIKAKSYFTAKNRFIVSNVCLGLFLTVLFIVTIVGHFAGGRKLFNAIGAAPESAAGFADIYSMETSGPLIDLSVNVMGGVLVPLVASLNKTVMGAISFPAISRDLHKLNDSIYLLPNLGTVRNILMSFETDVNNISTSIDTIKTSIVYLETVTNVIRADAYVIQGDLTNISSTITNVTSGLNDTYTLVNALSTDNTFLFGSGSSTGMIGSISSDLATISRSSTAGSGFPLQSTFDDAATGSSASMTRLNAGTYNGANNAELTSLNTKLDNIYVAVAELPNYATTAAHLRAVNDTIVSIVEHNGLIDQLLASITEINSELAALPSSTVYVNHVTNLYNEVKLVSLTPLRQKIDRIESIVNNIPHRIDQLYREAVKLPKVIPIILPIIYDLIVTETNGFNASITKLPTDTVKLYNSVSKTLQSSINSSTSLLSTLNKTKVSVNDVNISHYSSILDDAQDKLDNNINSFNFTELTQNLQSMFSKLNTNFTQYTSKLSNVKSSFHGYYLSNSTVQLIDNLQYYRRQLETALQRAISPKNYAGSTWNTPATRNGDYLLLVQGVCAVDTTVYCSSSSDCTSGSCSNIGTYRCSSNGVSSAPVVPCTADSTCTGSTYCLADSTRGSNLQTLLSAFGTSSAVKLPDTSSITTNLNGLKANEYDTSSVKSSIATAISNTKLVDTSTFQDEVNNALVGLDAFNMSDIVSTLNSVSDAIDGFDFSGFNKTLSQVQDKRASFIKDINQVLELIDNLVQFFYSGVANQLGDLLTRLSKSYLYQSLANSGASGMFQFAASAIDRTSTTLHNIFSDFTIQKISVSETHYTKTVEPYGSFFDKASQNPYSKYNDIRKDYGSLYYLMSQTSTTGNSIVDVSGDFGSDDRIQPYSVMYDSNGDAYPDNRYCVTTDCFDQTQSDMETTRILPSVPLTYANVIGLVWVPVGIVFFIGLCAGLCPLCTSIKRPRLRTYPAFCMLFIIILIVPWYLLGTAFFFPMAIVMSDGCNSGTHIGENYVTSMGDTLCLQFNGVGTLNDCTITTQGFNINVDIEAVAKGLMGTCDSSVDPFSSPLLQVADHAVNVLNTKTKKLVDENKQIQRLRRGVRNIITDSGTNAGNALSAFATSTSDIMDCDHIAAIYNDMTKPMCSDTAGAVGWLAAMLYLAAWTMCCLGIPAGCCIQHHYKWVEYEAKNPPAAVDGEHAADEKHEGDDHPDDKEEHEKEKDDIEAGQQDGVTVDAVDKGQYMIVATEPEEPQTLAGAAEIVPADIRSSSDSKGDYIAVPAAAVVPSVRVDTQEIEMALRPTSPPTSSPVSPRSPRGSDKGSRKGSAGGGTGELYSSASSEQINSSFSYERTMEDVKRKKERMSRRFDRTEVRTARISPTDSPSPTTPLPTSPAVVREVVVTREIMPNESTSIDIVDVEPTKNVVSMHIDDLTKNSTEE